MDMHPTIIRSENDVYVTKRAFYLCIAVIIMMLAAISISFARDISELMYTDIGVTSEIN